jgi:hypothetical protein
VAWLTCVRVLPGLRLYVETEDGRAAEIDVHAFIGGLDELQDPVLFAKVSISALGELIWPNGDLIGPDDVAEMLESGSPHALALPEPKIT